MPASTNGVVRSGRQEVGGISLEFKKKEKMKDKVLLTTPMETAYIESKRVMPPDFISKK